MGALSFVQQIAFDQDLYRKLFGPEKMVKTKQLLVASYCKEKRVSAEPCLERLYEAGGIAMKTLQPLRKMLVECGAGQELPISIDLPFNFHNVFVCPVNREPCSVENKPMLLTCGHVISRHALDRIAPGVRPAKFKCYTCPNTMFKEEVREIIIYPNTN